MQICVYLKLLVQGANVTANFVGLSVGKTVGIYFFKNIHGTDSRNLIEITVDGNVISGGCNKSGLE